MWPVVGHQRAVELLRRSMAAQSLSHAYLIEGPAQVGKAALALAFAQALNCTSESAPCGVCRPCRLIGKRTHPDVTVLELGVGIAAEPAPGESPGRVRKEIGVHAVRTLRHDVGLLPYEARWKVYVILDAEHLSPEAENALLKTLEEPPPQTILVLTTCDAGLLPPTVVSRCQSVRLHLLPTMDVESALVERWGQDPERAKLLARLSGGRLGWAVMAVEDEDVMEDRERALDKLGEVVASGYHGRFNHAEDLAGRLRHDAEAVSTEMGHWLGWWRDVLLVESGCPELATNLDRQTELERAARSVSVGQAYSAIRSVEEALVQLSQNANPRLALEVLMMRMPKLGLS